MRFCVYDECSRLAEGRTIVTGDINALFARAPFEQDGWDTALRALSSATGSSRAQLIAIGPGHTMFNWVTDVDEGYAEDFVAIEGHRADVNYRVAACGAPFEVTWERHYAAVTAERGPNEAYLDHVRRWDAEHGAQTVLSNSPDAFYGLAALHSRSDGKTTAAQRQVLAAVAPSVMEAIRVQRSIEHHGVELVRGSLEAIHCAAVLLDATGRVRSVTRAAEPLLGPGSLQVRGGHLRGGRPELDRLLQPHINGVLAGRIPGGELWLRCNGGPLLVEVRGLPVQDWDLGFAPRLIVTLKVPSAPSDDNVERLSTVFSLTRAEAEIVTMLVEGRSRQQIAAARAVSPQTVASQLRTIFQKCDVNREAELVSMARAAIDLAAR